MNFMEIKSGRTVLREVIHAYKTDEDAQNYIYLIAGVHGDEVEGVYVLEQLFNWIKGKNCIGLPLLVIPVLNIDGYSVNTRINANGVDLNRNFPSKNWTNTASEKKYFPGATPLSEPENQYLVELFEKHPPKCILSFHSWKPMLNFNGKCEHIAKFLGKYNNYPVEGDIGYPTPGSLGEFATEKYNSPVLTYELPPYSDKVKLKDIWEENMEGLFALMKSDLFSK